MSPKQSPLISHFRNIKHTKNGETLQIDDFLEHVKDGKWQDFVLPVRAIKDEELRKEEKKKVPYVTISGQFSDRLDNALIEHSGFIGIDIDDVDPEETKSILAPDAYVYAIFTSISGRGVCVLFKINGEKHREAHAGISEYLLETYNLVCDPTSVNPSRARFVSFDPHIYISVNRVPKFVQYPKKKAVPKVKDVVFAQTDFDDLVKQVQQRRVNLCETYHDWVRIAFAFVDKFGELGRDYFHVISAQSGKYSPQICDKQYTNCLKAAGQKRATISTFYYYCKNAGLDTYSERTVKIAQAAAQGKKSKQGKEQVKTNLSLIDGIEDADEIINQVFESNIDFKGEDTLFDQLEQWLKYNYNLKRNVITRYIEENGNIIKQKDFNSIFIQASKVLEKVKYENVERLINSDFTPDYNPIVEFIAANAHRTPQGNIDQLFECIESSDSIVTKYFGKKWLVSVISSIYGEHSPLMLVLCGERQGTGKTEFFRRLLPVELRSYYAESKLDMGKDDEILMTQKLIIMDDEMGGKSKKEHKRLKELTSKQTFSLREPYGRNNVDLNRLAVLCGTTNDLQILNDPTGNRRILPIHVNAIDHNRYNSIDKIDVLIEAYHLYKSGFNWNLTKEDIANLAIHGNDFELNSIEFELISRQFEIPENGHEEYLTTTEIKIELEKISMQKLSLDRIGKELQRIGYIRTTKRMGDNPRKVWAVKKCTQAITDVVTVVTCSNLPF